MRPSTKSLVLAAAAALLFTACADTDVVATVDDATIDDDRIAALRHSYAEGVSYSGETYRGDLTNTIYLEVQKNAAEEQWGITGLDDPDVIAAKIENPTPAEAEIFAAVAADPDRTEANLESVAEQLVIREVAAAELLGDEAYLTGLFTEQPEMVVEVCVRHILVATVEEAEVVKARLEAGEEFAAVAGEVSLDTQTPGGELPCPASAADYVMDFSRAAAVTPVGEVSDPVSTEFGWHILIVDERTGPETVAALIADPVAFVHRNVIDSAWVPWVNEAVKNSTIEVASQIGSWSPVSSSILPPPAG